MSDNRNVAGTPKAKVLPVGAVVRLNSGGPPMTVTGQDNETRVFCAWFVHDLDVREGTFPVDTLKREIPEPLL